MSDYEYRYAVMTDAETGGALRDIADERYRQITEEGYDRAHDDEHVDGELAHAGAAYAFTGLINDEYPRTFLWPWRTDGFKEGDRKRELIKAGALIVAELERIARQEKRK